MNFEKPANKISLNEAINTINGLMGNDTQTARMDREFNDYGVIFQKLNSGELTPDEAVLQARRLSAGRQEGGGTDFEED